MNHKIVPELTRSMLLNLENIEKVFAAKDSEKTRTIKASADTAPKKGGTVPRKHGKGGGSGEPAPKKAHSTKYCKWCKAAGGPFQTHDTSECRRFDKDGKEVGKPYKPFNFPKKKPWKKGGGDSGQMAYLTEKLEKLKKKLKKSKKAAKKRARDSSDSDSDSE
jgi:hypothetical protein